MRGFLILTTILAALVGWLFWAAPNSQAAPPVPAVSCPGVAN